MADGGSRRDGAAKAGPVPAAVLLVVEGVLGLGQGAATLARAEAYAPVGPSIYRFSLATWGWIHLVAGALVLLAGLVLFTGSTAARALGIALSALVVFANLLVVFYQPAWSVVTIGCGLLALWTLFHEAGPEPVYAKETTTEKERWRWRR